MRTQAGEGEIPIPSYRDARPRRPNRPRAEIEKEKRAKQQSHQEIQKEEALNFEEVDDLPSDEEKQDEQVEENLNDSEPFEIPANLEKESDKTKYGKNCFEAKEQLFMRKDNYVYFVSADGTPCDKGALSLSDKGLLPRLQGLRAGEVHVTHKGSKVQFAVVIKDKEQLSTSEILENISSGFKVLKSLIIRGNISTISIAKNEYVENVPWKEVMTKLRNMIRGLSVKIIICLGTIKYVEPKNRLEIIKELHGSAVGGHKGVQKTYRKIKQRYYWENLKEEVQNFVRTCSTCQLKKLVRVKTKQPMIITDTPHSSMDLISLDILGPFPPSERGHNNVLTVQCNFSKYCLAIALTDATAESVADALIKRVICIFGAPAAILTDQGSNFMSNLMRKVAKIFRIKQIKTTAYHPQTNGSLERSHHSLTEYIKTAMDKDTSWDDCLELATFAYNTASHEAHKFTPFELVFGKLARLPSHDPLESQEQLPTYEQYITDLNTRLSNIQEIARAKLIDSKVKAKYYYDKKINPKEFHVGDSVWLQKGGKPYKLADQYEGPYTVVEIVNDRGNVKIQMKNNKTKIVHVNRLRISHIEQGDE